MAAEIIEKGDIVKVEGNDSEWRVYWIYPDNQAELVGQYLDYPESVPLDRLSLIKKGR